jgi:hypothetical protein
MRVSQMWEVQIHQKSEAHRPYSRMEGIGSRNRWFGGLV